MLYYILYCVINLRSWGYTRKEKLLLNSDVFACQIGMWSIILVRFCYSDTWEEGTLSQELCLADLPKGVSVRHFFG